MHPTSTLDTSQVVQRAQIILLAEILPIMLILNELEQAITKIVVHIITIRVIMSSTTATLATRIAIVIVHSRIEAI